MPDSIYILLLGLKSTSGRIVCVLTDFRVNEGGIVTPQNIEAVKKELGLDKPLYKQYFNWLGRVSRLDFGFSFRSKQPVWDEIMFRFPATLTLALCATVLSIVIAIPIAMISAKYKNKWIDHLFRVISTAGTAMPEFWLGLLLLYAFAIYFKLFPVVAGNKIQNILLLCGILLSFFFRDECYHWDFELIRWEEFVLEWSLCRKEFLL